MSNEKWFSSKLRFVVMVEPVGGDTLNDCVFLFRAENFDTAFHKALCIGEAAQKEYRNADGQRVLWKFMKVISLDIISEDLDGAEIYSEPIHLSEENKIPFEAEFSPNTSRPIQTI
jgi:hypothetical protein